MAKDSNSSSTIWRTVVFAGAMLGSPLVSAESPAPNAPPKPGQAATVAPPTKPPPGKSDPAVEKQEKLKTLDGERTVLLAKLAASEPKEIDALRRQIVAKDAAIRKLVDEIVALRKPRPRTPVVQKPIGRGFVLA